MQKLAFIGLGKMGGPMARHLVAAGYSVTGYDLSADALKTFTEAGGSAAGSVAEAVEGCEAVMSSLPNSDVSVAVAEGEIRPAIAPGQIVIDLGTITPPEARRLAPLFTKKGAVYLDVPVSGNPHTAGLRLFGGGDRDTFQRCRPILEVIGDPEHIVYAGESGSGQVVKGVNQLATGLINAALLEAVSFGVNAGVPVEVLRKGIGGGDLWRQAFDQVCEKIQAGDGNHVGVKVGQYGYFLREAGDRKRPMPITESLGKYLKNAEIVTVEANRPSPSFWRELTKEQTG